MSPQSFENMKLQYPHLSFEVVRESVFPSEKTYTEDHGIYNIIKRIYYKKSNGKKCYVDYFLKEVNVPRNELCPAKNGYEFRVKNKFIEKYIN